MRAHNHDTRPAPRSMYAPAAPIPGAPNASLPPNGPLYPHRERLMSRVHSRGTLGEELGHFYNVTERSFVLVANASAAQAEKGAGAAGGGGGSSGGWARGVAAALRAAAGAPWGPAQDAALAAAARANGSVTEVYLPRSIAANCSVVAGAAAALGVLAWPDGSRSAYFAPTAAGEYTLGVAPAGGGGGEGGGGGDGSGGGAGGGVPVLQAAAAAAAGAELRVLAARREALLRALPQLADLQRAAEAAEGAGAAIVRQRSELVRRAARAAGYELQQ